MYQYGFKLDTKINLEEKNYQKSYDSYVRTSQLSTRPSQIFGFRQ